MYLILSFAFQALCKHCEGLIPRHDSSTTIMIKHLREVHPVEYDVYLKAKGASSKEKLDQLRANKELEEEIESVQEGIDEMRGSASHDRKRPVTTPISQFFGKKGPVKYKPDSDFQRRAELDTAIYIVTGNLSFNHIETEAFRRYMASQHPKATIRSRSALVKSIIPLLERNLREAMDSLTAKELPKCPGAGFTTDTWTSRGQRSYISLTMHFIDSKWTLRNLLMACQQIEEDSHTSDVIGDYTERLLTEINLLPSVNIAFTTDGASVMVKAMNDSPMVNDHVVCFCHIISNSLQQAFEVTSHNVKAAMTLLKELAGATHKSTKRISAIRRACSDLESKFEIRNSSA